jgi:TonB-linked SusC/RagA family outer membrane protein
MTTRIPLTPSCPKWSRRVALLLAGSLAPALGWAQQAAPRTVSGRITADNGEALAGVSVVLKGTETSATTDAEGRYTLVVSGDASVLVVCALGYACQELPARRDNLTTALRPETPARYTRQVVGYGTQLKTQVTGAVITVGDEQLRDVPVANIGQALQGRVPGLSVASAGTAPGQNPVLRIRGNRSFLDTGDPLLVVDGVPFDGNLNDLNPDDIATVDVLKDASATAIYGGRGASGVLLLTTRRGRAGAPRFSYDGYAGPKTTYGRYDLQNGQQFYNYRLEAFRAQNPGFNPNTSPNFLTPDERANYAAGKTTDYQDLLFQTGRLQNHSLGLSGGTDRTQYSAALGYYDETGIVPVQRFQRYSLRGTLDQQLGQRVKVGLSTLNAALRDNDPNVSALFQILTTSPLASPYDASGNPVLYPNGDQTGTNPLALYVPDAHRDQRRRWRTFNSLYGQVNILPGLDYRANMGVDIRSETSDSYYAANTPQNGGGLGTASYATAKTRGLLLENVLTYSRTLGRHYLHATGLYSRQQYHADYTQASAVGVTGPIGTGGSPSGGGNSLELGLTSLMGRLHYAYADRYSATLTARQDGSSRLPPGGKNKLFPAAAVAWNLANEAFLAGSTRLSTLKLRASLGRTGGAGAALTGFGQSSSGALNPILNWESTTTLDVGLDFGFFDNRVTGSLDLYRQRSSDLLIPDALPSGSGYGSYLRSGGLVQNRGLEIGLTTVNVRAARPGGFAWRTEWNFTMNREQILDLGLTNADGSPRNDLGNQRFIGQPLYAFYDYKKTGIWQTSEASEARRYNSKPGQIKVEDLDNNGVINPADRQLIGSRQPQFEAGLTNHFSYKGFDMTIVALTRVGATVVDPILFGPSYYTTNTGRRNQLNLNYWTPTNPTNDYPQPDQSPRANEWPTYGSTLGYRDGTFLKVRSIDLGYTLPAAWAGVLHLTSARVYVQVQNPLIWARDPYFRANKAIDPDALTYSTRYSATNPSGIEFTGGNPNGSANAGGNYPATRAFLAGVNLSI